MKVFLFKHSVSLVYILGATVLVLMIAAFLLYAEKSRVLSVNHALILQNDSIISEHINLKQQMLQREFGSGSNREEMSSLHQSQK